MINGRSHNSKGYLVSSRYMAELYSKNNWFRDGYLTAFKDQPYQYDIPSQTSATAYERGRAFAIWCKINRMPRAVWRNNVAAKTVIERIARAIEDNYVI